MMVCSESVAENMAYATRPKFWHLETLPRGNVPTAFKLSIFL